LIPQQDHRRHIWAESAISDEIILFIILNSQIMCKLVHHFLMILLTHRQNDRQTDR